MLVKTFHRSLALEAADFSSQLNDSWVSLLYWLSVVHQLHNY